MSRLIILLLRLFVPVISFMRSLHKATGVDRTLHHVANWELRLQARHLPASYNASCTRPEWTRTPDYSLVFLGLNYLDSDTFSIKCQHAKLRCIWNAVFTPEKITRPSDYSFTVIWLCCLLTWISSIASLLNLLPFVSGMQSLSMLTPLRCSTWSAMVMWMIINQLGPLWCHVFQISPMKSPGTISPCHSSMSPHHPKACFHTFPLKMSH